jgi:acetyl esterase/lipase
MPDPRGTGAREFHRRPATPAGSRFLGRVEYSNPRTPLGAVVYAREVAGERRPVLVHAHGGGWRDGAPEDNIRLLHGLAERGFVTAGIQYRFVPRARWPAQLEDLKAAIAWVREHHAELGADPDRIVVGGGSAGGQLAAMAALDPEQRVAAAVLGQPVTDLSRSDLLAGVRALIADYAGGHEREASPIVNLHRACPPILTLGGGDDVAAAPAMLREFHDALDRLRVPNRLAVYPGGKHAMDVIPHVWEWCFRQIVDWLDPIVGA